MKSTVTTAIFTAITVALFAGIDSCQAGNFKGGSSFNRGSKQHTASFKGGSVMKTIRNGGHAKIQHQQVQHQQLKHHGNPHQKIQHQSNPHHGIQHHGIQHHGIQHHGNPHHGNPHHGIQHHGIQHHSNSQHKVQHHGVKRQNDLQLWTGTQLKKDGHAVTKPQPATSQHGSWFGLR